LKKKLRFTKDLICRFLKNARYAATGRGLHRSTPWQFTSVPAQNAKSLLIRVTPQTDQK